MNKIFKFVFSFVFFTIALLMIFSDWFSSRINNTIIVVILLGFLPWFIKYVSTLEAFGMKIDLISEEKKNRINKEIMEIEKQNNKNKINDIVNNKELCSKNNIGNDNNPILIESMETIARTSDVIEKLILIKYELDKNIMILCRVNNIQTYQRTIIEMINDLSNKKIVDEKAINLLLEIIPELDRFSCVKSKKVDMADAQ